MAIKKFEHVGIMVKDLEQSIGFYKDVLGLDLLDRIDHNDPSIKLAFLGIKESDQICVELVFGAKGNLPDEGKVHHIAFTVDNIEDEIERLQSHEVIFIDEEITTLTNGAKYIFLKGPDGELLELFQPPGYGK
ncbi:glyoxalase [Bacillus sp. V3-13]|uniref:VOC family protein n=1 Tax=Bacillus sp. V3-13 TaxID=2053728 RepID=UPI000C779D51|nr:VOC family protein [Bacillus sp. V3-13]PLR75924.1 glyoxalase [Bacillus sp. V3-13]